MSRKGGTGGGGLVHPESEKSMAMYVLTGLQCHYWLDMAVTVACQIFDVLRRRESRLIVSTVVLLIANYPTTLYIPRGNLNVWLDFFQGEWLFRKPQRLHILHIRQFSMLPDYQGQVTALSEPASGAFIVPEQYFSDNMNGYRMYIQDRTSVIVIRWRQSAASTMNGILK